MTPSKVLTRDEIDAICMRAVDLIDHGDSETAWSTLAPLLTAQTHNRDAANALFSLVNQDCLSKDHALAVLEAIDASHGDDTEIASAIAHLLEKAFNIDFLNQPPFEHPIFARTITRLEKAWISGEYGGNERWLVEGLAGASRLFGRQKDDIAEQAYKRAIEIDPKRSYQHYNYGLFLKTRGRFEEAMRANEAAARLADEPDEAIQWNLGICATGAGHGDVALKVWKDLGHHIEMGRFDLPEGRYPECKVRLAERPLAERTSATDDPGQEETIWIERLSGCHGIVNSVLYHDLGVNYGDVILFDGAPITHHMLGDKEIPVFPHLATLLRRQYKFFRFAGTQDQPQRIMRINARLAGDAAVYSHTDNVRFLCNECWTNPGTPHSHGNEDSKHIVTGKIAAPPSMSAGELLKQLDAGLRELNPCQLYTPDLCRAAGLHERADVEQRRFDILTNN